MKLRPNWWLEPLRNGNAYVNMAVEYAKATQVDVQEYPDDWFIVYGTSGAIKTAGSGGFITLSRKGFDANREEILKTWSEVTPNALHKPSLLLKNKEEKMQYCVDLHAKVLKDLEDNTRKRIVNLKGELAILESALKTKFV